MDSVLKEMSAVVIAGFLDLNSLGDMALAPSGSGGTGAGSGGAAAASIVDRRGAKSLTGVEEGAALDLGVGNI